VQVENGIYKKKSTGFSEAAESPREKETMAQEKKERVPREKREKFCRPVGKEDGLDTRTRWTLGEKSEKSRMREGGGNHGGGKKL